MCLQNGPELISETNLDELQSERRLANTSRAQYGYFPNVSGAGPYFGRHEKEVCGVKRIGSPDRSPL
jgi:hypothetical protein